MSFQDVRPGQTARRRASPPGPRTSTGYYNGAQVNGGGPSRGEEAGARAGQAQQGGFGSAGALRTGGVRVGRATPAAGNGSLHHGGLVSSSSEQRQHRQHQGAGGSSSGGGQVGDSLMVYSVRTMTHLSRIPRFVVPVCVYICVWDGRPKHTRWCRKTMWCFALTAAKYCFCRDIFAMITRMPDYRSRPQVQTCRTVAAGHT